MAHPKSKHDRIIRSLENRLKNTRRYDLIQSTTEYNIHGRHGECDLFAIRGRYALILEIKTHDSVKSRTKVYQQLKKDSKWIKSRYGIDRVFKFYAYRNYLEWIR